MPARVAASAQDRRAAPAPVKAADELAVLLHQHGNTLASLRLRMSILAADPTCRWAQEENLAALVAIVEEASEESRRLRRLHSPEPAARRPGRRRGR